ncbi:hypothetical protein [Rubellicoccus peritrichatus]|uniref:Uncharacterized protein n=1 Tax=Rubellicoccus peritrichatus TaxID=3080537 RepID=A0AAQ3QUU9_9BACT|nr:hypothetical protein [Puniceicoccus sp. CR14]WOO40172.1 hypothetical protein RZN69_16240 [Puniceicoccus sp. CR14]
MKVHIILFLLLFSVCDLHAHQDEFTIVKKFNFSYTFERIVSVGPDITVSGSFAINSDTELEYLTVKTGDHEVSVPSFLLDIPGRWYLPYGVEPQCFILRPEDYGFDHDIGFYVYFSLKAVPEMPERLDNDDSSSTEPVDPFLSQKSRELKERKAHIRYLFLKDTLVQVSYGIHEKDGRRWDAVDYGLYHLGDKGFSKKEHRSIQELAKSIAFLTSGSDEESCIESTAKAIPDGALDSENKQKHKH